MGHRELSTEPQNLNMGFSPSRIYQLPSMPLVWLLGSNSRVKQTSDVWIEIHGHPVLAGAGPILRTENIHMYILRLWLLPAG